MQGFDINCKKILALLLSECMKIAAERPKTDAVVSYNLLKHDPIRGVKK